MKVTAVITVGKVNERVRCCNTVAEIVQICYAIDNTAIKIVE